MLSGDHRKEGGSERKLCCLDTGNGTQGLHIEMHPPALLIKLINYVFIFLSWPHHVAKMPRLSLNL